LDRKTLNSQNLFRLTFAVIFLIIQHKYHSIIIISISTIAFSLAMLLKSSKYSVIIIWIYALCVLFFKESYRLQNYPSFHFLRPLFNNNYYGGMYRWQLPTNFLILRLISFCLDYHWSRRAHDGIQAKLRYTYNWKYLHLCMYMYSLCIYRCIYIHIYTYTYIFTSPVELMMKFK
jgi:hypothetical protein